MKEIERFCTGCNKKHKEVAFRWKSDGKNYYCSKFINCIGCKKYHKKTRYMKYVKIQISNGKISEDWICDNYVTIRRNRNK